MIERNSRLDSASAQPEVISGIARNAKAGAIVIVADGSPIYVDGLSEWSEKLEGQRVTLTGIVKRKAIYPAAQEMDGGEIQGMVGSPLVITPTEPLPM